MLDKSIQVGIVGLGMIGGSIAKSLIKKGYKVFADDLDKNSLSSALSEGSIDGFLGDLKNINPVLPPFVRFSLPKLEYVQKMYLYLLKIL